MKLDYSRDMYEKTIYMHLHDPRRTPELKTLRQYDSWAVDYINRLKEMLEVLNDYRFDLMERAQYLATAQSTLSIELHRRRTYYGKIEYYLQLVRTLPDGTSYIEQSTQYHGSDRHKAIADFKVVCKAHPGAPTVLDIQKGKWER